MPVRRSTDVSAAPRTTAPTTTAPVAAPKIAPKPVTAPAFTPAAASPVQKKLNEIRSLMAGHTDRAEEARILSLFRDAPAGELNQLMAGFSRDEFHELTEDMDDRLFGAFTVAQVASITIILVGTALVTRLSPAPAIDPGPWLRDNKTRA